MQKVNVYCVGRLNHKSWNKKIFNQYFNGKVSSETEKKTDDSDH